MSRRYTAADRRVQRQVAETFSKMAQYQRTLGETDTQRLSWLEDFARQDFGADGVSLDEPAVLLNWFVVAHYRAWAGDFGTAARLQHMITPGDVPLIQRQVRDVLTGLEPGGIVWFPHAIVDGLRWSRDRVVSVTRTPGAPQVLASVADLLASVGPRLRRCETPSCRRLFAYNRPAQKRCRVDCGGTDRVRAWREKNRERLSEHRHQQYAQKVKAERPNVRVGRRRPRPKKGA